MRNRIEYLVKYSVALPPSRDYYGLKVFEDEVILYLWKISHGPHKAPIVYSAKFTQFDKEKSLQNEIRRGFGKYLLKYVKNIADGNRNTLLTLPKSLIGEISKYLEFTDILKLSSLSHIAYEVFNTNLIWQILYAKDKTTNINLEEKGNIIVYNWKQLYKEKQMQASSKNQRNLRIPSSITNNAKTNKLLMKPINDAPNSILNKMSMTKKRSESSDLVTIPLSKTKSDTRFRTCTKNEQPFLQKKNIKKTSSIFNMNENIKKDFIMSKTTTKQETGNVSKHNEISDTQINRTIRSKKNSNKININMKSTLNNTITQENKLKSKAQTPKISISKNIVGNIKSSPILTQNSHSKTRSKIKSKPKKKIIATKSDIFNTDKALSENSFITGDDRVDLADLIEEGLKNIRSPQSIFDYDFSCIQQSNRTKDVLDIRNEIQNINKLKQLKPTRTNDITNNFSHKIIRGDGILEKLSEKSESFSEASNESFVNDKQSLPGDNKPFSFSEKYIKAREELRKSLDWKRSDPESFQNRWNPCLDMNFQNKYFMSPEKVDNNNEKFSIPKRSLKTSFLKVYAANNLENKKE